MTPLGRDGGVRVRLIYLAVVLSVLDGCLTKHGYGMQHDTLLVLLALIGGAIGSDHLRPSGTARVSLEAVTGAVRRAVEARADVEAGERPGAVAAQPGPVTTPPPAAVTTSPPPAVRPQPEVSIEDEDTADEEWPSLEALGGAALVEDVEPSPSSRRAPPAPPPPVRVRVSRRGPGSDDG